MAFFTYCTGSALKAELGAMFVTFIDAIAEIPEVRHLQVGLPAVFEGSDGTGKTAQLGLHQDRRTVQQMSALFMVHQEMEEEGSPTLSNFLHRPFLFCPASPAHKMVLPTFTVEFPFNQGETSSRKPRGEPQPLRLF